MPNERILLVDDEESMRRFLGVLLEGQAAAQRLSEDPTIEPEELGQLAPGDHFGEMSLLTGELTGAEIVARTTCRHLRIPAPVFARMLAANPVAVGVLAEVDASFGEGPAAVGLAEESAQVVSGDGAVEGGLHVLVGRAPGIAVAARLHRGVHEAQPRLVGPNIDESGGASTGVRDERVIPPQPALEVGRRGRGAIARPAGVDARAGHSILPPSLGRGVPSACPRLQMVVARHEEIGLRIPLRT